MRFLLVKLILLTGAISGLNHLCYGASFYLWVNLFRPLDFAYVHGALPVAQLVIIVLALSYFLSVVQQKIQPKWNFFISWGSILLIWILIAALFSSYRFYALNNYAIILKYILPLFFISSGIREYNHLRIVLFAVIMGVGIWASQAGLYCIINGTSIKIGIPGGQLTERNDFSAGIVATLPLWIYYSFYYNWAYKNLVRLGIRLVIILNTIGILFSLSRGAVVGLISTIITYILIVSKSKIRDTIVLIGLISIVIQFLPPEFFNRMKTIQVGKTQTEASARSRMNLMISAWKCTLENPITGIGPGCWTRVVGYYIPGEHHEPHSIWLKMSAETGFPGLILYIFTIFGSVFLLLIYKRRYEIRQMKNNAALCAALSASIIGYSFCLTFGNGVFNELYWAFIALSNAYIVMSKEIMVNNDYFISMNQTNDNTL